MTLLHDEATGTRGAGTDAAASVTTRPVAGPAGRWAVSGRAGPRRRSGRSTAGPGASPAAVATPHLMHLAAPGIAVCHSWFRSCWCWSRALV